MSNPIESLMPDVSRETLDQLRDYVAMVEKWNLAINLVSKSTLPDIWDRHIADSVQLYRFMPEGSARWVDLGSGGGFPGLVIAILALPATQLHVDLVESDARKSVFLREVIRSFGLRATVHTQRIEECKPLAADVLSARALAPLVDLCGYASIHLKDNGVALFLKGSTYEDEIARAQEHWTFDLDEEKSVTNSEAKVLVLKSLRHV